MSVRRKKRRLAVGRILQVALAALVLVLVGILVLSQLGLPLLQPSAPDQSFDQFMEDLRAKRVASAVMDGNIVVATYRADSQRRTVVVPNASFAVEKMLALGVSVSAARALPASGINLLVLAAILLPYSILAYFAIGVVKAAEGGADVDIGAWKPSSPEDAPAADAEPARARAQESAPAQS